MVEFLRTSKISSNIEDIIIEAKEQITFVTPYLKLTKILYERLKEKDDEGVQIRFVYGKVKLLNDQEQLLKKLKNISIHFLENLHAKCYINEFAGIVTSMNLYDFSEKTNREMGIYFKKNDNENLFAQVNAEVESIIKAAKPQFVSTVGIYKKDVTLSNQLHNGPRPLTYIQRLIKKLALEYPNCNFQHIQRSDSIICDDFSNYFKLVLEPKGSYFRIDFRIADKDSVTRQKYYYMLYDHRYGIEKYFPYGVVNWGNQMKRIKLDFPQDFQELDNLSEDVYFQRVKDANYILENVLKASLKTS